MRFSNATSISEILLQGMCAPCLSFFHKEVFQSWISFTLLINQQVFIVMLCQKISFQPEERLMCIQNGLCLMKLPSFPCRFELLGMHRHMEHRVDFMDWGPGSVSCSNLRISLVSFFTSIWVLFDLKMIR